MSKLITLDNLRTFKAKLDKTISSSGGGTKTVDFNSRAYTTNTPIYAEDLAILLADRNNTITLDSKIFRLADNQVKPDSLYYTHLGGDGMLEMLEITISTRKWTNFPLYNLDDFLSRSEIDGKGTGLIFWNDDTDEFSTILKKSYKHTVNFEVATDDGSTGQFFFMVESDQEGPFTSTSEIEDGCYTAYSSNVDSIIGTLQVFIDNVNGVFQVGGGMCVGNNTYSAVRLELNISSDNVEPLFQN